MRAGVLALAATAVVLVVVLLSGGDDAGHRVTVTVDEATSVVEGQYVEAAGEKVGSVTSIEPIDRGRKAKLELKLDDRVWPLTEGAEMTLRWGGSVSYSNRYIALERGRPSGRTITADGVFPTASFRTPVEFDGLLRTFDGRTRVGFSDFLDQAGPALEEAKPALRRTLASAPPAVDQARRVLEDIEAEGDALQTLINSGSRVFGALQTSQPGVRELLSGAGATFDAIADQETALRATLDRAPSTFRRTRTTLRRADSTLREARDLTVELAPGIAELRRIAAPLNGALGTVAEVGPSARQTLATARTSSGNITSLLDQLTGLAPQLGRIGAEGDEALSCIRPFTPDILSFFTNWGDFFSVPDERDKMIRAQVQQFLPALGNAMPYNSADAAKAFPGLEYGFPRPPGTNAGQPWFLPECGAGPDALDPNKDPESRPIDQVLGIPRMRAIVPTSVTRERRP